MNDSELETGEMLVSMGVEPRRQAGAGEHKHPRVARGGKRGKDTWT